MMPGAYYLELTIAGEREPRGLFFSSLDEAAAELRWWEQDQRLERALLRLLRTRADLPGFASSAHQAGVNPLRSHLQQIPKTKADDAAGRHRHRQQVKD